MSSNISIGGKNIGEKSPCFIIAEVGSNHDRSFEKAIRLIDEVSEAKVDAIKFQLFKAEKIASSYVSDETRITDQFAKYGSSVIDLYRKFELPAEWIPDLIQYCKEKKITFLATPFDLDSIDILESHGVVAYKIASFELTYLSLIKHAASTGKPILLSTGMANLGEIEEAISAVENTGNTKIALFHCNIGYPALPKDVHLRNIETMKVAFGYPVGYSDHTEGFAVPIAAVALGSNLLEKHITFEDSKSPDHDFALRVEQLKSMVENIRIVESSLGEFTKKPRPVELKYLRRGRRSIFAMVDISPGDMLSPEKVNVLRPGTGINPKYYDIIIGKRVTRAVKANTPLQWEDLLS